jgi:hypothetical protein
LNDSGKTPDVSFRDDHKLVPPFWNVCELPKDSALTGFILSGATAGTKRSRSALDWTIESEESSHQENH